MLQVAHYPVTSHLTSSRASWASPFRHLNKVPHLNKSIRSLQRQLRRFGKLPQDMPKGAGDSPPLTPLSAKTRSIVVPTLDSKSPESGTLSASIDAPNNSAAAQILEPTISTGTPLAPSSRLSSVTNHATSPLPAPRDEPVPAVALQACPASPVDSSLGRGEQSPEPSLIPKAYLNQRKKRLVDGLMAVVEACLDEYLCPLEEANETSGGRSAGSSHPVTNRSSGSGSSEGGPGRSNKRQLRRDDQNSSEGGDEGRGRDRNQKRAKKESDDSRFLFACPYFKRDPIRFKNCRTCCGPGWKEFHRVKEHVTRRHKLPRHVCHRCCLPFKDENALKEHNRAAVPCDLKYEDPNSPRDLLDGFDQKQEEHLKRRVDKKTDTEKWHSLYCVLFFLDPNSPDLPSPYYDETDRVSRNRTTPMTHKSQQQYIHYLRRELPPMIRCELERDVEQQFNVVEEKAKEKIVDFIRDASLKLFRTWTSIPPPTSVSESRSVSPEPAVAEATSATDPEQLIPLDEFDFHDFLNDPTFSQQCFDLPLDLDLDVTREQESTLTDHADSAYNSIESSTQSAGAYAWDENSADVPG